MISQDLAEQVLQEMLPIPAQFTRNWWCFIERDYTFEIYTSDDRVTISRKPLDPYDRRQSKVKFEVLYVAADFKEQLEQIFNAE